MTQRSQPEANPSTIAAELFELFPEFLEAATELVHLGVEAFDLHHGARLGAAPGTIRLGRMHLLELAGELLGGFM